MSTPPREPTEEELRVAYEAQLKQLKVEDVLIQTVVSLINLGGRKAGLAPGAEDERDLEQLRLAIEGARALLPLCEQSLGADGQQVRDAIAQLQLVYAQGRAAGGGGEGGGGDEPGGGGPPKPDPPPGPGPGTSSGRLWVPGQ
jgi:hypothetical protein